MRTRKRIIALLPFLALLLPGASLAQGPEHSAPPSQPPLMFGGVEPLMSQQKEVLDLLLAKRWKRAQKTAQKQLLVLEGYVDQYPGPAATALALEALADAGSGDKNAALCRWKVALSLDPKLAGADLSPFGAAGELLRNQSPEPPKGSAPEGGAEAPGRVEGEVTRPEILFHSVPLYPEVARRAQVTGKVIVESIIAKDGSISEVRVLQNQPMGLGLSAMDSVCGWRFKPATLKGEPVKVYYVLTVTFDIPKGLSPAISHH